MFSYHNDQKQSIIYLKKVQREKDYLLELFGITYINFPKVTPILSTNLVKQMGYLP